MREVLETLLKWRGRKLATAGAPAGGRVSAGSRGCHQMIRGREARAGLGAVRVGASRGGRITSAARSRCRCRPAASQQRPAVTPRAPTPPRQVWPLQGAAAGVGAGRGRAQGRGQRCGRRRGCTRLACAAVQRQVSTHASPHSRSWRRVSACMLQRRFQGASIRLLKSAAAAPCQQAGGLEAWAAPP